MHTEQTLLAENGPIRDSTFVLRAFSALHEGCLTLPLWVEMTYNNCKFPCNLNNFSRPFHCLLFGECKKWIWGPLLFFVFTHPSDMGLPTTFLNTNLQLFNSNAIILGQHTIGMPFERGRKTTPFQMHNVTYCQVSSRCVSVGAFYRPCLQELKSEHELDQDLMWRIAIQSHTGYI